ncbi:rab gtpase [Anaeramoeba ignava]|uniref:Rab gtpase n=1 Tax=Anaeramoeba ignava TaxID=1746090 RepID=A0A9Q0LMD7_ANAIG|nr:rab gtpase [Anaeramoeba ignava]
MQKNDLLNNNFKVCFLGDYGVGKTSIITRFLYDSFDISQQATVGIDFISKTMRIDDQIIRLHLWDTAGQEKFRSLLPTYIRDSSVAIVVFDISKKQSFENLNIWLKFIQEEHGEDFTIFIVGNKTDLNELRQVSKEELEKFSQQNNFSFFEVSAKTGENVKDLFRKISSILISSQEKPENSQMIQQNQILNTQITLDENNLTETPKRNGCC